MHKPLNINFTKMHGLGNDFMVVDATAHSISFDAALIQKLSQRHLGIGFDQLLLIGKSNRADFSCRFFNADGSEAEQCGNGVRCVARFLHEHKMLTQNTLQLDTKAGVISLLIHDYAHIQVNMGSPKIENVDLPGVIAVSMGNPHAILLVDSIKQISLDETGKKYASHPAFPQGVNVGFMEIANRKHIRLRTYERGVGETCACGSNACAAVVAGIQVGQLDNKVIVELAYGNLEIELDKNGQVLMTGPAENVFIGKL